jgi:DNA-directed RNA polymerase subunit RPC12/RpoP
MTVCATCETPIENVGTADEPHWLHISTNPRAPIGSAQCVGDHWGKIASPAQPEIRYTIACDECGHRYFITDAGVAHHVEEEEPDGIDHMLDEDHAPYVLD